MWITIAQEDGGMPGQPEDPRRVGSEPSGRVLSAIALDLHGPPGRQLPRVLGYVVILRLLALFVFKLLVAIDNVLLCSLGNRNGLTSLHAKLGWAICCTS